MFKTLSSEYINRHHYFTARKDSYVTGSGKIVDPYFVVELPTGAGAMALTQNNEVILIKQYRYPINEIMIEIPGGFIDAGEQPEVAIRRELLEETGYSFDEIHLLGKTALNPGVLNNFTYMFLATGGVKTNAQQLDANEEIEIILKPLEEVRQMLMRHEIKQSMHALCMFYGFEYLKAQGLT
jgi:ADP-ribose pyrophosphatase